MSYQNKGISKAKKASKFLLEPALLKRYREVRALAEAHGIFTHDRALGECRNCQLFEDISFLGKLFIYRGKNFGKDTGLKFEELNDNALRCPGCGKLFCPYESSLIGSE